MHPVKLWGLSPLASRILGDCPLESSQTLGDCPLKQKGQSLAILMGTDSLYFTRNDFNTKFLQQFSIHFTLSPLESYLS